MKCGVPSGSTGPRHDNMERGRMLSWNDASAQPDNVTVHIGREHIYVGWVDLQDNNEHITTCHRREIGLRFESEVEGRAPPKELIHL